MHTGKERYEETPLIRCAMAVLEKAFIGISQPAMKKSAFNEDVNLLDM